MLLLPALLALPGATTTTTTTATYGTRVVAVDGAADGVVAVDTACVEEDADTKEMYSMDRRIDVTDTGLLALRLPFGSCKPSVSCSYAQMSAP